MSNMKLLSSEEALKRQMERLEKRKGKRVANTRKHPRRDEASDKGVVARFPADVFVYFDPGPMLKQVDQLLFLEDETCLTKIDELIAYAIERLDKAADEAVIQTKGELLDQYLHGGKEAWEPEKDIEIWQQWKELKALEAEDDEGDEEDEVEPKEQFDALEGHASKDNLEIDPPVKEVECTKLAKPRMIDQCRRALSARVKWAGVYLRISWRIRTLCEYSPLSVEEYSPQSVEDYSPLSNEMSIEEYTIEEYTPGKLEDDESQQTPRMEMDEADVEYFKNFEMQLTEFINKREGHKMDFSTSF
ncbi:hypothetical protein LWI29_020737 [Acer saccharum]|uniref:Uncharacterized protein n=1 Tax=Acer saccharum TaxID=4024 RepID=A0AA39VBY8_ACESA|nr:hypothetical protein LWI29_020737 [Acer saccharum]